MTPEQIQNWFSYHAPTAEQQVRYQNIRAAAYTFASVLNNEVIGESADKTAAFRLLRECVMTANAAIACEGR